MSSALICTLSLESAMIYLNHVLVIRIHRRSCWPYHYVPDCTRHIRLRKVTIGVVLCSKTTICRRDFFQTHSLNTHKPFSILVIYKSATPDHCCQTLLFYILQTGSSPQVRGTDMLYLHEITSNFQRPKYHQLLDTKIDLNQPAFL